jgi:hypothetical protein
LKGINDYLPIILYYNFEPILDEEYFCKIWFNLAFLERIILISVFWILVKEMKK